MVGYSLDDFLDPKNIRNKFGIKFVRLVVSELLKVTLLKVVTLKLKVTRCSNVVGYSLDDFLDPKNLKNKQKIISLACLFAYI